MQGCHDLRALADACRHALDGACTDVPDREDARDTRFERAAALASTHARQHETLRIKADAGIG